MFDSGVELPALGAARLAGLIEQNHAELMTHECRTLQLACAWADAHYLDSSSQDYQPLIQRACAWGRGRHPRSLRILRRGTRRPARHRHRSGPRLDR